MDQDRVSKIVDMHRYKIIEKLRETISNQYLAEVMHNEWLETSLEELLNVYASTYGEHNVSELVFDEWYTVYTGGNIINAYRDYRSKTGLIVMVYLVEDGAMVKRRGDGSYWSTAPFLSNDNDDGDYELLVYPDGQESLAVELFDEGIIADIRLQMRNFDELKIQLSQEVFSCSTTK